LKQEKHIHGISPQNPIILAANFVPTDERGKRGIIGNISNKINALRRFLFAEANGF
jgi:hypothetical protein